MADTNYISQITLPDNSQYLIKAASVPLAGVTGADDLKAIEALSGTSGLLKKTATDTWALDTSSYVTSSGVTSITLTQGAGITVSDSGTAITGTGNRTISITGINTNSGSTTKWLNQKGEWSTPTDEKIKVSVVEDNSEYPVLVANTTTSNFTNNGTYTGGYAHFDDEGRVTINPRLGKIRAAEFAGGGGSLTGLNGSNISSGTVSGSYLGVMGSASSSTAGSKGAVPAPAAGDQDKYLRGDGTWATISTGAMIGATSSTAGAAGSVPAPAAGDNVKFLCGDGTWKHDSHITAVSRPNSSDKYPVLAINEDSYEYLGGGSYTGTAGTNVTIQPNTGTLNANYFVGNGSGLTNISASAVPTMTGATSSAAGTAGKVPAPAAGDQAKFLRGDGTWAAVAGDNNAATHTLATTTKYFVTGTTTSTTNTSGDSFDTGVYVTTTAGELSAVRHTWNVSGTDKAYTYYNSTDDSIRFAFV